MADEIEVGVIQEPEPEKKGKGKLIGIVGGVLVLVGAAYFLFLGGGGGEDEAAATETTIPVEGPVIEVDEMTITLADEPVRYARLKFAVVLPEGGDTTVVGDRVPVLKDAVLSVMSGYTADQLLGPAALAALRDELTTSALTVYTEGEVLRVVITEVLVQ